MIEQLLAKCFFTKGCSFRQGAFSTVVAPKRPSNDTVFQTKASRKRGRDEENYIAYRPKDFNSERGSADF